MIQTGLDCPGPLQARRPPHAARTRCVGATQVGRHVDFEGLGPFSRCSSENVLGVRFLSESTCRHLWRQPLSRPRYCYRSGLSIHTFGIIANLKNHFQRNQLRLTFGPQFYHFRNYQSNQLKNDASRGIGTGFLHRMSIHILLALSFERMDHIFKIVPGGAETHSKTPTREQSGS